MRSFRISSRRAGRIATTAALLVATIVPSFAPALASAAVLTDRSVALSSSAKGASGVSYNFKFVQETDAPEVVIQFCTNSPLIGEFCDAPAGMVVTTANAGAGVTTIRSATGSTIKLTKTAGSTEDITITGITNPSGAGTVYARILTYANTTDADVYNVTNAASAVGTAVDQGSVAFAITDSVSVSGAVLETLTFCVSGGELTSTDCATGYSAPVLTLGEDVGDGTKALNATNVSTGSIYTKLSTNAVKGAVVSLKSTAGVNQPGNVPCAGLALYGTGTCSIAAAGTTGSFIAGAGKFGVRATLPTTNDGSDNNGIIALEDEYDTSDYRLDASAAIGTYGSPLFNTSGGYANNRNVTLTFGATAAPNTPAGKYSAAISLIATGTF